jgi:hypothetical protein
MSSQSGHPQQPTEPRVAISGDRDLEEARLNALQTVAQFRRSVASLEVKHITDTRLSSLLWETYCISIFSLRLARWIGSLVGNARSEVNTLLRNTANVNRSLFDDVTEGITRAETKATVSEIIRRMEATVTMNSERRKSLAVNIMTTLREELDMRLGPFVDDRWYQVIFRMALGLGDDGGYHPAPIPPIVYAQPSHNFTLADYSLFRISEMMAALLNGMIIDLEGLNAREFDTD